MEFKEPIKINLGSGQRPFGDDWINIDNRDQGYKIDILADVKNLSMFSDNSVSILVAHHLVEHIPIHEYEFYLKEWYRILKPGGILTIAVPDMSQIDKAWLENKITTYIHNVNTYGAYQGYQDDLHKWGYNTQELVDRTYGFNEDRTLMKFPWKLVQYYDPDNKIYVGANIAQDWYILILQFMKA